MSVENETAFSGPYTTAPTGQIFPFLFHAASEFEVGVLVDNVEQLGGFTVALAADRTGTVSFSPLLASGKTVYIFSKPNFRQEVNLQRFGPYFPDTLNAPLDRAAIRDIFLKNKIDSVVPATGVVPATLAGKYLAWDASGAPIASVGTGNDTALRTDLAQPSGASLLSYINSVAGVPLARTVTSRLRDTVSVGDCLSAAQIADIRSGAGTLDPAATINAFMAANPGKRFLLPEGDYYIATDLRVPPNSRLSGMGRCRIFRRTGGTNYLVGNLNKSLSAVDDNIEIDGIIFDGRRTGSADIPAHWCAYFSWCRDLYIHDCTFKSADSDGLVAEYVYGLRISDCLARDNVKPGIYVSGCDRFTITGCSVYDCVNPIAYGIAIACAWYGTITGCMAWNCPNGGLGLARDARFVTVTGNYFDHVGTESEPFGNPGYLGTVVRPNRGVADSVTPYGASDILFHSNVVGNQPITAGLQLINSHRWIISDNTFAELGATAIKLIGSTDTRISGNTIYNVGKNNVERWCILATPNGATKCNRTVITDNNLFDTQASPTSLGIQIADPATVNCEVRNNRVALASFPLYEDATTAPLNKHMNYIGTALTLDTTLYIAGVAQQLYGSTTYDPPSLIDGARASTTVSCVGARLGDVAQASFSLDTQGIVLLPRVSANDTVTVQFKNESGATVDLASGTLRVRATKL